MNFGKTIPPAGAPLTAGDLLRGLRGLSRRAGFRSLEHEIGEYFGVDTVFPVSSGKAALVLILKGLAALRARKKVVIPAYTCYSVPSAIVKAGLDIALCDVEPDTLDFDYPQLERVADDDTLCVVATHLFGIPSDVERIRRICAGRDIFVVEDAAQAMGVRRDDGRFLGTAGDVGFFSLGRGKNITCGNGGIVLTSSPRISASVGKGYLGLTAEPPIATLRGIAEAVLMKVFLHPSLYWLPKGLPFLGIGETRFDPAFPTSRLGGFRTGLLARWKERMAVYNGQRAANGAHYTDALGLRGGWAIHSRPTPYLRFPLYAKSPGDRIEACSRFGSLGVNGMYPDSVNRIERLRGRFAACRYPGAEWIAARLVTLPTHALLSRGDRERICRAIEGYCGRKLAPSCRTQEGR